MTDPVQPAQPSDQPAAPPAPRYGEYAGLAPDGVGAPSDPDASPEDTWSSQRRADDEPRETTVGSRVTGIVLSLIVGVVYGCIGTVAHGWTPVVIGVSVPLGLILGVLGIAGLLTGLRIVLGDRLTVAAAALGMLIVIGLFTLPSSGGSVLIPQGITGLIWTIAPSLVAVLVLAWPKLPVRPEAPRPTTPVGDGAEFAPSDRA
jgi:hypothetical protein